MNLNMTKFEAISVFRRLAQNVLLYEYQLSSKQIKRVDIVNDLCGLLDTRMTFKAHLNTIDTRGKCLLGFIKRQANAFGCTYAVLVAYTACAGILLNSLRSSFLDRGQ